MKMEQVIGNSRFLRSAWPSLWKGMFPSEICLKDGCVRDDF